MSVTADTTRATRNKPYLTVGIACSVAAACLLGIWLWHDLSSGNTVYVVGDSITSLSATSISEALTSAAYAPTVSGTLGVKIGQAQAKVTSLAGKEPWAWIIELGTDDAGAKNQAWSGPFQAEWQLISSASCVIYVTISPRAGPVGDQINAATVSLAKLHSNVHVLDWGNLEYTNPTWVTVDGIHPTPQGQAALANLETQELQQVCT